MVVRFLNPFGLPDLDVRFPMTRRVAELRRQRRVEFRNSARNRLRGLPADPIPEGEYNLLVSALTGANILSFRAKVQ